MDADLILPQKYLKRLMRKATNKTCLRTVGKETATNSYRQFCGCGIMLVPTQAVFDIRGYDESFAGYGEEDIDFRDRLKLAGYNIKDVKDPFWVHISHSDFERGQAQECSRLGNTENRNRDKRLKNAEGKIKAPNGEVWGVIEKFANWQHYELK